MIVSPAEGAPATVPFWRGEGGGRTYDLGLAIGAFLRDLKDRIDAPDLLDWLQRECHLDANAARNLRHHVTRQLVATGSLPTDRTLQVEASRDQLGDWQVVLLSPLGTRLHLSLRMALEARLRQRLGYRPQCMHHNDGVLLRFTDMDEPLLDLFDGLTPENVEGLVLDELADSPLFALRFRQNAARSLLMPRGQAGRRAPLWLQRMRGRDLLQVCRRHAGLPGRGRDVPRVPPRPSGRAAPATIAVRYSVRQGGGGRPAARKRRRRSRRGCCSRSRPPTCISTTARRPRAPAPGRWTSTFSNSWSPRNGRRTCWTRGRFIRWNGGCAAWVSRRGRRRRRRNGCAASATCRRRNWKGRWPCSCKNWRPTAAPAGSNCRAAGSRCVGSPRKRKRCTAGPSASTTPNRSRHMRRGR